MIQPRDLLQPAPNIVATADHYCVDGRVINSIFSVAHGLQKNGQMFNIKNPIELSMKLLSMMLIILMGNCNIAAQKYFEYIGGAAHTYETRDCIFYNNIYYLSGVYYNITALEFEGTISMIDAHGNLISELFWDQEPSEYHANTNITCINDTLYTVGTYDRMDIANDANFCSISKVDKTDGALVSTNYFGQPDFSDLTYLYDGNSHFHAGYYYTESHYEPFILKTDSHFNVLWDTIYTQYNTNLYNLIFSLAMHCIAGSCDYWAYGNIEGDPYGPDGRLLFIKFNPDNGEILHTIIKDFPGRDAPETMLIDSLYNIIFTHKKYISNTNSRTLITKMDTLGQVIWTTDIPPNTDSAAQTGLFLDDNNHLIFGATGENEEGDYDTWIYKVDAVDGQLLWSRHFGCPSSADYLFRLRREADGSLLHIGSSHCDVSGDKKVWFIKTNCMGLLTEPLASFTAEEMSDESIYSFTNTSQFVYPDSIDGGRYLWDFGDGTISQSIEAIHGYAPGSYYANLTAIVCQDTSRYGICLQVGGSNEPCDTPWIYTSVHEPSLTEQDFNSGLLLYPNPSACTLHIDSRSEDRLGGDYLFYNVAGSLISAFPTTTRQIDVCDWPVGIYFCEWVNNLGMKERHKLVIAR